MEREGRRKRGDDVLSRLVVGTSVLAVGLIFWLDRIGRIDARDFLRWWPVILVAFGLVNLVRRRWVAAVILFVIALLFMPSVPLYLHLRISQVLALWPLLISLAGTTLILQSLRPESRGPLSFRAIAVMGGNERSITATSATDIPRGEVVAVMGGCEVDLTRIGPARKVVLDLLVFWGGVEIHVPRGWVVSPSNAIVIGALVNNTERPNAPDAPQLVITGSVIMGGVEVKNPKIVEVVA